MRNVYKLYRQNMALLFTVNKEQAAIVTTTAAAAAATAASSTPSTHATLNDLI